MPLPSHLSPDNILRFLQIRSEPASTKEIAEGLHLKKTDSRRYSRFWRNSRNAMPSRNCRAGATASRAASRIGRRPAGSRALTRRSKSSGPRLGIPTKSRGAWSSSRRLWFVVPDSPIPQLDGDVFIPRDAIEDAMHGDHVLARVQRRAGGRSGAQRAEGRIIRILNRAHPSIVGLFRYGPNGNTVLPYDVRIQHEVEIPRGQELTPGLWKKLGFKRLR